MRLGVLLLVAASGLAPADKPDKKKTTNPVQEELKKLEGTWTFVGLKLDGLTARLVIKGNQIILEEAKQNPGGKPEEQGWKATFKVDPGKKPKTIDVVCAGTTSRGIYQQDGDTLKICVSVGKRPTTFTSSVGSTNEMSIFKRTKRQGRRGK
jgi:uncharacterized protein (TIGR03067 family)